MNKRLDTARAHFRKRITELITYFDEIENRGAVFIRTTVAANVQTFRTLILCILYCMVVEYVVLLDRAKG